MTATELKITITKFVNEHSTIYPNWPNDWAALWVLICLVHLQSRCNHLNFGYSACFEQGVPWHSGNCKVWIHSEKRKWHGINIQYIHCFAYFIWLSIKWLYLTKKVCFQATHLWYMTAKSYRYIFFLENSKICLSLSTIVHRRVR